MHFPIICLMPVSHTSQAQGQQTSDILVILFLHLWKSTSFQQEIMMSEFLHLLFGLILLSVTSAALDEESRIDELEMMMEKMQSEFQYQFQKVQAELKVVKVRRKQEYMCINADRSSKQRTGLDMSVLC